MIDIKAATLSGAIIQTRVRLLWQDGELRGYGHAGRVFAVKADKPVRRKLWLSTWDCQTELGPVAIEGRCWTCGGWLKVAGVRADKLWEK